jgi:hypothetical protein
VFVVGGPSRKAAPPLLLDDEHCIGGALPKASEISGRWRVVEANPVNEQSFQRGNGKAAQ